MFSEPGSCSFLGVSSNSSVFVSDKDLNNNVGRDEYCQTSTLQEDYHEQLSVQERDAQEEDNKEHQEEQTQEVNVIISVPLDEEIMGSENEGFKTPTSSDQKIPVFLPGAPRKTKSMPAAKKRKTCSRRIMLEMSKELDSLFPCMPFVVDLCASGKNKKLKHGLRNHKMP